jgi:hypothetical protein
MRDETFDKLRALCLLLFAALAFLIVAVGIGWLVSSWVEANYGSNAVLVLWVLVLVLFAIFAGWKMTISTMKVVLAAYTEVQTADDTGEIARIGAQRDLAKAAIWGEKNRYNDRPVPPVHPIPHPQQPALTANWQHAQLTTSDSEWSDVT